MSCSLASVIKIVAEMLLAMLFCVAEMSPGEILPLLHEVVSQEGASFVVRALIT